MTIFYLLQKYKSTSVITEPAYFLLAQSGQMNFFLVGGGNSNIYRSKIRQIVWLPASIDSCVSKAVFQADPALQQMNQWYN